MTKVTLRFELLAPLDERLMNNISRAGSLYGLLRVQITPGMDGLVVDYDASRLTVHEVEHALGKAGIPVKRATAQV
jgi:allophanate hydrolase subunit 1